MIVEIPDDNSIIKWRMNDKEDWKSAEISDLINAYEKRSNEQIAWEQGYEAGLAQGHQEVLSGFHQGEWINHRNDYGHNIADCSLCGKTMQWHDEDGDGVPRYCWYCGAPMKGVKAENKNPREGMDFKDYLAEKLKDPEFKKEWENVLKEEKNGT